MTEDEARLSRCCGPEGCGGNSTNGSGRYCLESFCMAWRQTTPASSALAAVSVDGKTRRPLKSAHEAQAYRLSGWNIEGQAPQGFCGLAGQP